MACSTRARSFHSCIAAPSSAVSMSMLVDSRSRICRVFEAIGGNEPLRPRRSRRVARCCRRGARRRRAPRSGRRRVEAWFGRPLQLPRLLDLSRLAGIRDYQPSELVLTAGAATPIEEIDAALAQAGQMLAFEPPDLGALFGLPEAVARQRTLGGALACNLSGPRRIKRARHATIFSAFAASADAAKSSRQAAKSSKTSPDTIFAS